MLKAPSTVTRQLKAYDQNLEPRWNNQHKYWEIWYRKPSGWKLITPVVEGIYRIGGNHMKCEPLDIRIIDWIASSDSSKCKKWKWLSRMRYNERKMRDGNKTLQMFTNIAKDNYNWMAQDLINPYLSEQTESPDLYKTNSRQRVMYGKKYQ